jgi:hypothetical protein
MPDKHGNIKGISVPHVPWKSPEPWADRRKRKGTYADRVNPPHDRVRRDWRRK